MDEGSKATLFNALAWVDALKTRNGVNTQDVDTALSRLTEAFGVDVRDLEQKRQLAVNGDASFEEIFAAGLKALNLETGTSGEKSLADEDPVVKKHPELWKKWVAKLESKGFFKDAAPGTAEHATRTNKALAKFKEKFGDVKPELTEEERQAKAEEMKAQGNAALSGQDYEGAAKLYREALQLSPNGPSSHIYHSNLAAALTYLGKYTEVIDHCEQSIGLKPSYVKAYSRMGSAQVQLKDFDGAIDTFRRGLEVDSTNAACRDGLADAERKRRQVQTTPSASASAPAGGAGGMPDLSNLASMLGGGGGGLADLMNNPQMMQMAQNMMQNPQMMQMAQNMMQNPDMMSNLMGGLGGAGGAGAGAGGAGSGMPDMSGLMNSPELMAARSDPDLADFFRDVDSEGPSAAMRHMSNPKVSQLMQNVMSRMQG